MNTKRNSLKTDRYGNKYWFNKKNQLHRINQPAVELMSGTRQWYMNGQLHRIDGPAIEFYDGDKHYYRHGERIITEEELERLELELATR